jgi:alpha-1,2-mannosyltransferase
VTAIDVREPATRTVLRIAAARDVRRYVVVVFGLALAMRVAMVVFSRGGIWGTFGYDGSVYYAAGDALTFGRLPYRDFVLLHPPAVMLALVPFALFGRMVGDHAGYVTANVAFEVLGAVNAALVVLVARRLRLSRVAALLGGAFYSVWSAAVGAEFAVRLEPLGSCAFLLALLAVADGRTQHDDGRDGRDGRRWLVLGGVALGVAISTKIWWIVPAVSVVAWQLAVRRRAGIAVLGGLFASLVVVNAVFFVSAPGRCGAWSCSTNSAVRAARCRVCSGSNRWHRCARCCRQLRHRSCVPR